MNFGIVINKEKDYTSRDVINKLNHILRTKKIGHTGTLDPLATGVLVCLIGKYTKLVSLIMDEDKEYIASIKLGIKTDTLDITGNIIDKCEIKKYNLEEINNILKSFLGEYHQIIPLYSAKRVNGKRLYEYARSKEEVKLPESIVNIKEIELLDYHDDLIKFRVVVSKGTYIRSLIQSMCDKLNCYGTMNELIRTRQGKFRINNSYTLNDIENNNYQILKIEDLLDVEVLNIPNGLEKSILNGNKIELDKNGYILFKKDNEEIALYYFENKIGRLKILF